MEAKPSYDNEEKTKVKGLDGVVPDPARPPQGCRFHTWCSFATERCGWEVDDLVRWLEDTPGMFKNLDGVQRRSEFSAVLSFSDEASAGNLSIEMRSRKIPGSMRNALKTLKVDSKNVGIEFEPVDEVALMDRGGRSSSCILDPSQISEE